MNRLSPKVLLVIAVILSIGTAGLVYSFLKNSTQQLNAGQLVVVAVKDIPGRATITQDMVKVVKVPPELLQSGIYNELSKVVGVMARVPISAGDQITERRLAIEGKVSGFVGSIPKDKRAYTIAATDVTGVAGFVKAGDYVDIVAAFDKSVAGENLSKMLLQNVLVLAANRNDDMEVSGKGKKDIEKMVSVTLAVSPEEAAELALAEAKGKVHLALRPFQPNMNVVVAQTVTPRNLVGGQYQVRETKEPIVVQADVQVKAQPAPEGIKVIRSTKVEMAPVQ